MIFPSIYEELDMNRYATLAIDIVSGKKLIVALCDDTGQVVWMNDDLDKQAELFFKCCATKCGAHTSDGCCCVERTGNGVDVACFNLGELAGGSLGELVFYDIGDEIDGHNVIDKLRNIAALVKAELGYLYEVNAMASELGDRYDELSMLRASDVALNDYHESRHILSTYIRSCGDHLKVDYAAIWLATRNEIYPGGIAYENGSIQMLQLMEQLSITAFAMFENFCDGFGINDKDEALRAKIKLPADKKALLSPVLDDAGKPTGVLVCLNEFSHRDFNNSDKSTLEAVARKTHKYILSTQDEMSGLLNREGFEESVWRDVTQFDCERHLVLFNIDQFKIINAVYGIAGGDAVLSSFAVQLKQSSYPLKYAARLGADLFAALIEAPKDKVASQVERICDELDSMLIPVGEKKVSIKTRAGVISVNSKETTLADHLYAAELALASAREESKNRVVIYKPGNTALLKRQSQLMQVENIKQALEEDRFTLFCQRILPLKSDEMHYEILVRMVDESGDLVPPDDFIPVAERYGLMGMVDRWIIEHTFMILSSDEFRDVVVGCKWGINLSGMSIGEENFNEFVSTCLKKYEILPTNIYFEITETAAIKNFQNCKTFMDKTHSIGVQFALDDFGSGLSSFSYLKKLSIDYLKIDGSLVKDVVSSRLDQTMVSSIADIATVLQVKTIAEYVENDSILEKLISLNIDYAQGYGIMKPRPVELELRSLLEDSKCTLYSSN